MVKHYPTEKFPAWKIATAWLTWTPFILIRFVGIIVGALVVIPLAMWWHPDKWPKLIWLWNNDEEYVPAWVYPKWSEPFRRYYWYAYRNPFNNLRFVKFLKEINEKDIVEYRRSVGSGMRTVKYEGSLESLPMKRAGVWRVERWMQAGWRFSFRRVAIRLNEPKYHERYIGWKLAQNIEKKGLGFALQNRESDIGS